MDSFKRLLVAVAVFVGQATGAWAEKECPPGISPDKPVATVSERFGVPLDQEFYYNLRGVWMKVPYGYVPTAPMEPLPPAGFAEKPDSDEGVPQLEALGFSFWMPNLRWPERDMTTIPWFRPCEDGRTIPEDGAFIVNGRITWPWLGEDGAPISPLVRYRNGTRYLRLVPVRIEHGLVVRENPKHQADIAFSYYFGVTPSGAEVELRCRRNPSLVPNPSCSGDVWWSEEALGMFIFFSQHDVEHWIDILDAAHDLATQWRDAGER